MSAMGSVIVMYAYLLPARLGDAGYLARMDEFTQANTAEPELAQYGVRPTTTPAPGISPDLELRFALRLDY
jgi:hypothetical protein